MIDFRYHLVSLMAVLIALTMGVVLGAGPLQGNISSTLSGEVDRLKEKQDSWTAERNQLVTQLNAASDYADGLAQLASANILSGHNVAVVELPGVEAADREEAVAAIQSAGGNNTGQVQLAAELFETGKSKELKELAEKIKPVLTPMPAEQANDLEVVANGVITSLVRNQDDGSKLRELLDSNGGKLVKNLFNQGNADLVLVIAPSRFKEDRKTLVGVKMKSETAIAFAQGALTALPQGIVFTGNLEVKEGFLTGLESDNKLVKVTASSWGVPGQVRTIPLLLRYSWAKGSGSFGVGDNRDGVLPKDFVSVVEQTKSPATDNTTPAVPAPAK